jgi:hypothetical protein
MNNRDQKISIKYIVNEGLIIIGITDKQKATKIIPIVRILEIPNISLEFFSN